MATSAPARTGAEDVRWDLTHFYGDDAPAGVDADLEKTDTAAREFAERYRGRVAELTAAELAEALRTLEDIEETASRAGSYAQLNFSTDVADPARGALLQKVQEALSRTATQTIFFNLEWINLPDATAAELLKDEALANYRHYLESARRYRPYVLSEPEEKLMVEKSVTARAAWDRLFDEATAAVKVSLDGEELGLDGALAKLQNPDPERRKEIAQAVTDALRQDLRTRRFIFNTVLADKSIDDRLRGFPSWISDRNLSNEASDESVAALVEAVTSRYDITHRYYALKKRLLKLETFNDWDRYAPLDDDEPEVGWDEAKATVLDAYQSFSPKMRETAQEFFDKGWIDAPTGPNKRGGAFSHPTIPSLHPYVMLNYTGRRRDVLVLAHELGHGIHQSLARVQTPLNFDTPLTTAETASIFGETVTFSRLLDAEQDPRRRLGLLVGRIDDAVATIFRQVAMNRFEDAAHTHRRGEGELSDDDVSGLWLSTQRAMLGPAVAVSDNYGIWWSYVHHFIAVPGYVYAYAFGNLMALAIYKKAEEEGPAFAPRYFELLAAGGSDTPEVLTSRVGVKLSDPNFWAGGLDRISRLVDDAEALAAEL